MNWGVKIPELGINVGENTVKQGLMLGAGTNVINPVGAGVAGAAGIMPDMSIKDPAGMQQYTDIANQAQQEYGQQRDYLRQNVDPKKKQLLEQLAQQASGQGPSIAEGQLKSAFDKSLQQQLAMARSSRGGNAGLANRNAANVAAQQQQNLAGQSAVARMQEQRSAQQALQDNVNNEMDYASGTMGNALGAQANVAAMQNGQRDRNDKRTGDIFNAGTKAIGSMFGMFAEGGQVPSLEDILKHKYGKAPQKLAYGGKYREDVGDDAVRRMEADTKAVVAEKEGGGPAQSISGLFGKAKGKKSEMEDDNALDMMVDGFEAEDQLAEQAQKIQTYVPVMPEMAPPRLNPYQLPMSRVAAYAAGGYVTGNKKPTAGEEVLNTLNDAELNIKNDKKQKSNSKLEKDMLQRDITNLHMNRVKRQYDDVPMSMKAAGGSIPGEAEVAGDSFKNDKVPILVSPGEVVVPRTVAAQGPIASGYFVKKASEDSSYNAKTFASEKVPLAKMLASMQEQDERYNNVKSIMKKGR